MTSEKVFVPPIKIQGIKTKLVPFIKKNVVLHYDTLWIEPFMGSGVVGFNIAPERAIFADINPYIVDFYNQIKFGKIDSRNCSIIKRISGSTHNFTTSQIYYRNVTVAILL